MPRLSRRLVVAMLGALLPLALGGQAMAAPGPGSTGQPTVLSAADVARLSAGPTSRSIVILRNQHPEAPARPATAGSRASTVAADQQAIRGELSMLHSAPRSLHTVNAIAASISQPEAERLAANPAVLAVVADRVVQTPAAEPAAAAATDAAAPTPTDPQQVCPSNPAAPLLEPEALQLTNTEFQPGDGHPAAHGLVDGTGVRVAFIADGLDINNPDLTRAGHSIVFDYQDFTGDGVNGKTGGGEAFGDAASIAAQGNQTYDLSQFVNPAHPLPPGCTIRIRGMAPGASLASLKVFGLGGAFASTIVQAIDWAIERDHVDVINESFGGNPFPDDEADPIQIANENAAAAGVTVVASSGDAGFTSTIGNTGTTAHVISVGATTQLRLYRQETAFGSQLVPGGWIDNNPSAFSSSGFAQESPRTIDVVAPGDLGWALCSTNTAVYIDCTNNARQPSNIEIFGGTSESAPLVSGEAALVIQAYRTAHGGASPSSDLVKRIIMSTAADLNIPAQQQGSGLVDALKAVQEALSVHDTAGSPARQGSGLLLSRSALTATGPAGAPQTFHVQVTNTGSAAQRVTASLRHLAPDLVSSDAGSVTLNPATAPTFLDGLGRASEFAIHQFTVPAGVDRLNGELTWAAQAKPASIVRESLFDPLGRFAMYSIPQGPGGFAHVDVHDPMAGTWTAVIWSIKNATVYNGDVSFQFTTQRFAALGAVSPAVRTIQPGQTASFEVRVSLPALPGNLDASLVLGSAAGSATAPVTLRSLVRLGPDGGTFSGVLEGGNGRSANNSQQDSFQFDVPHGKPVLNLALTLRDPHYRVLGFLVDPSGEPLDIESDAILNPTGALVALGTEMQFFQRSPRAGRWTLVVRLSRAIDGTHFQEPFTGHIGFTGLPVTAAGLPDSAGTVLQGGRPVTATVQVTNTGVQSEFFFVDPRLDRTGVLPLLGFGANNVALPLAAPPAFLVPTDTTQLVMAAQATVPIVMAMEPNFGQPEPLAVSFGNAAVAVDAHPEVAPGFWFAIPEERGPFPPNGGPKATVNVAAAAETSLFDPAVTSSTGDVWLESVDPTATFRPLLLAPGQTGTITVVITPGAPAGTVVRGSLQVDTFTPFTNSGDQVVSIPYAYRVG